MQKYIGVERVEARPMTRGDYNVYRGWQIPADENPADEGYLVKRGDVHENWIPKESFRKNLCRRRQRSVAGYSIRYEENV